MSDVQNEATKQRKLDPNERGTRHTAHQGTRRYDQLADHERLRERVRVLRGAGRTAAQIAVALNAEDHRPARSGSFTAHRVRHLVVTWGLTDTPPGSGGPSELPGPAEWWLPELAREFRVPPLIVHQWRWAGWVRDRQLPGRADVSLCGRIATS